MNEFLNNFNNDIIWSISLTLGIYFIFFIVQKKTKITLLNPLLLSSIIIILILLLFKIDSNKYLSGTKFITFLIAPATVSLAIPLYENIPVIKKNWKLLLVSIFSGVTFHALLVGIIAITMKFSPELLASFLPKSVTTPIAIDISKSLGGIENLTVIMVVLTGILGATVGPLVFKVFNIKSKMAQGLSLGLSSHAVGTSKASELGEVEKSFSTIALILTGITTVLLSPLFYKLIMLFL